MNYFFFFFIVVLVICLALESSEIDRLKQNGIKVRGSIISNQEVQNSRFSMSQLGGNINMPTVQFKTEEGKDVTGTPLKGFISQYEIVAPLEVDVIYDPENPEIFCLDFG